MFSDNELRPRYASILSESREGCSKFTELNLPLLKINMRLGGSYLLTPEGKGRRWINISPEELISTISWPVSSVIKIQRSHLLCCIFTYTTTHCLGWRGSKPHLLYVAPRFTQHLLIILASSQND